jgi:uncharacterized protein YdaU (DUF1376 family)
MGDYQRDTGALTLAQDGAYRRLMDHYYSTEEPPEADRETLYRICGAMKKEEREAVDYISGKFFENINGKLHHQRIDEELSKAQEKIANLKANGYEGGVKSGTKRASKNEANASANGQANDEAKTKNTNTSNHTKPTGLEKTNAEPSVPLPAWLPEDLWSDWVAYRKSIKAKLTQRAAELCIDKLAKLMRDGNDPRQVVEQSIMSGKWTGLFPIKPDLQARASPAKPEKFDPVAHVNRNRI